MEIRNKRGWIKHKINDCEILSSLKIFLIKKKKKIYEGVSSTCPKGGEDHFAI